MVPNYKSQLPYVHCLDKSDKNTFHCDYFFLSSRIISIQNAGHKDMQKKVLRILWTVYGCIVLLIIGATFSIERGWIGYMPPLDELQNPIDKYASQVFSADGKLLGTWSQNENRIFTDYDSISSHMFDALIATEDVRFYQHSGIDAKAFGRAVVKRGFLGQRAAGGGSTITQQLAKQLYSKRAHSTLGRLFQKPIEWVIAVELERHFTKKEILTLYLNYFDFLHNAVGIKTAAKVYFQKTPQQLTITEAAMLVGMCKNPSYYNPITAPDRCKQRRNVVLDQMVKGGYLNASEAVTLKEEPLGIHFKRIDHKNGPATYLREYLRRILMADKPKKENYADWQQVQYFGDSLSWANDPLYGWCKKNVKRDGTNYDIYTDGLKIYTTIDSRMQRYAEEAAYSHVAKYLQPLFYREKKGSSSFPFSSKLTRKQIMSILARSELQSERYRMLKDAGASEEEIRKSFHTKIRMSIFSYRGTIDTMMTPLDSIRYYKSFLRTGLVSIDPSSGQVKAYVGGLNYNYFQYDMAFVGRRQIGSTMKPFVYSLAMEDGLTPSYTIPNVMRTYMVAGRAWTPRNGSKARYGSSVPLSWGLAQSNNWVTAGLMSQIDPTGHRLAKILKDYGVKNPNIYPSIALCLGPCDVTVGELASAYTAFVNGGIRVAPLLVTKIEDAQGNVIAEFSPRVNEVISEESADEMITMLRGVVQSGTAGRLRYKYNLNGPIAGKTGTTNNNSDGWFVGLVPRLVTACWVGGEDRDIHFDRTNSGQGATVALPIWAYYMKKVYRDHSLGYKENEEFKKSARPKTSPTPSVQGNNMTDDEEAPDPEPQPQRNTEAPPPKRPANQPRGESLFE